MMTMMMIVMRRKFFKTVRSILAKMYSFFTSVQSVQKCTKRSVDIGQMFDKCTSVQSVQVQVFGR